MKKICFVTGTRADYGILAPVMKEVVKCPEAKLQIIATNMHLSPEFGMTVNEIEEDGFRVDFKIESYIPGGTDRTTVESMAKVEEGMATALDSLKPDMIVILGDRYEALSATSAAVVFNIPIAHLHGGEITEGAIDDKFRNAITQMATLHFASTPQYVERIISMGAIPENVFHSGAPGADIKEEALDYDEEFFTKTGLNPYTPYIILAMHPVTLLEDKGLQEVKAVVEAMERFITRGYKVLLTMPNSDPGTAAISKLLTDWANSNPKNVIAVKSLGAKLFHYAMEHAAAIVGNSSAALIEAPTYRLPAVNVGRRQKGRAHGATVINIPAEKEKIIMALEAATSLEMKGVVMGQSIEALNPYYKKDAAEFISRTILDYLAGMNHSN